jgi:ADP-heptose:LPS heptosyltransferase
MRVGYRRKWGWLLTHALPDRKAIGERHEVEYNLDLVRALGIEVPPNPPFRLPIDTRAERAVEQLLEPLRIGHDERLVALHPWTSNPRKQWPGEWFGRLAERLIGLGRVRVLLLGGASERALGRGTPGLRQVAVVDLVGRLSLPQTAALLRRVRVLVSNDSGPVHVAAAVGTPTVVLFGGSSPATGPQRWGPWGPGHTVLCKPALDQISLQEVLDAVGPYL